MELNSALCVGFAPGVVLGTIPQTLSCSSPEEGSWRLVTVCPLRSRPLGEKNRRKVCISCLFSLPIFFWEQSPSDVQEITSSLLSVHQLEQTGPHTVLVDSSIIPKTLTTTTSSPILGLRLKWKDPPMTKLVAMKWVQRTEGYRATASGVT